MEAPISPMEISSVIRKLSDGKAMGLDNVSNEMLKVAGHTCLPFLTALFTKIYATSSFPAPWKKAYITTLYKKGAKNDPANYRPISITNCFGKVFTSVLNVRLMSFMVDKNIAHPFQGAFTKGKRCTDHILVANTLIDQARHTGNPLYAAFIDLQKAYDSVCRPLLFRKMVSSGLGPRFCQLIEDMYTNSSSCIKLGTALGTPFSSRVGLRQGIPSPRCSLICLWLTSFLPSQTGVILRSYTISLYPQSSSQTISAIFHHLRQGFVPLLNALCNTVRPIDSRSIWINRAIRSLTTPTLPNLILFFRDKCSNLTLTPVTWGCACPMIDSSSTQSWSVRHPRLPLLLALCSAPQPRPPSSIGSFHSLLSQYYSMRWSSGFPTCTPVRWKN